MCPQLFPELFTGGVGPHGAAPYNYDPDNPSTTKFPPYFDGAFILGEFTQDTMREVRLDSQDRIFKINPVLNCGPAPTSATRPFLCDNPMDMEFGPDGNFYLLTYGDGFFAINPDAAMERFEYVKGLRAPVAVLTATPTDGQDPLTVSFSSEGSHDPDPGDSIRFEWDFNGDGTVDSVDPNPTFTYTTRGVFVARLTVTDSSGKVGAANTTITVGNTSPTVTLTTPVDGGTFAFGDNIPFAVTVSDPEDGAINCAEVAVTFVLGHDTHGHAQTTINGCSGVLPTDPEDVSHGGNVFGVISASYTDHGGAGGVPALTTVDAAPDPPEEAGGRVRGQPVRHQHRGDHRRRWRAPAWRAQHGRLDRAQRTVQPSQHQPGHVPHLRRHARRQRRHGRGLARCHQCRRRRLARHERDHRRDG